MSMLAVLTPGTPATEALGRVLDAKAIPAQLQGVDSSSAAAILEKDHQRLAAQLERVAWVSHQGRIDRLFRARLELLLNGGPIDANTQSCGRVP